MTNIPVEKIAKLSNLTLETHELERFGNQLKATVEYVDNLQELNTEKVDPTSSPSGNKNVFFEDGTENVRTLPANSYKVGRIL